MKTLDDAANEDIQKLIRSIDAAFAALPAPAPGIAQSLRKAHREYQTIRTRLGDLRVSIRAESSRAGIALPDSLWQI